MSPEKKKAAKKVSKKAAAKDDGAKLFLTQNVQLNDRRVARLAQEVALPDLLEAVTRAFEDLTAE